MFERNKSIVLWDLVIVNLRRGTGTRPGCGHGTNLPAVEIVGKELKVKKQKRGWAGWIPKTEGEKRSSMNFFSVRKGLWYG